MNRNADRQITLGGVATAAALLGLAAASVALPESTRRGWWLPLHLGLAGAGGTAVASVLPFFTTALTVARPARPAIRVAAIVLVAGGALTVSVGMAADMSSLAVVGGLLYLAGLVLLAGAAFGTLARSLGQARRRLWLAYGVAIAQVLVGVALATAMLAGFAPIADRWGQLKPAHAWLNVFGFLSLTVAATLVHLAPTIAGTRIRPRRSASFAVVALILGVPLVALGFAAGNDAIAQVGALTELAGAAGLVIHALFVQRDRGRWTTDPSWHRLTAWSMVAAPCWFFVATLVAGGRIVALGASPGAWSLSWVAAPLALGWVAQVLIGAWSHLLPAIGPGDMRAHARQRRILGRGATARILALNAGVLLLTVGDILAWVPASAAGVALVGASVIAALATFLAAAWPGHVLRPSAGPKVEGT